MSDPQSIIAPIRSTLRWLVIATILVYVVIAAGVVYTFYQADQVEDSLCTIKIDREDQIVDAQDEIARTEQFLTNPDQLPPSFNNPETIALLEQGLQREREDLKSDVATVAALDDLDC